MADFWDDVAKKTAELLSEIIERVRWRDIARPEQLPPNTQWLVWLILAGRGFGKTRTGAEWVAEKLRIHPGCRVAIVAPTFSDGRDTCVEGESGLLRCLFDGELDTWNRSMGEVVLKNGSRAKIFSGDTPERLRGPQHHFAWVDELAAFQYPEAWDQLQFGLRLGVEPQVVVTTTPRPTPLIKDLMKRDSTYITRGSTFDNAKNLAPSMLEELRRRYENTRLGRQELYAEILDDVPGALASHEDIDEYRVLGTENLEFDRKVVAVDPAMTSTEDSDETGISVQGLIGDHVYQLADLSGRYDTKTWGEVAVRAAVEFGINKIVVETNQGGDSNLLILKMAMKQFGVNEHAFEIVPVHARLSKMDRAIPLGGAIQQGRYHIVGRLDALEDQLTSWVPTAKKSEGSPDRLDAVVHGYNELVPMQDEVLMFC